MALNELSTDWVGRQLIRETALFFYLFLYLAIKLESRS